jgi:hypothetical protein
VQVLRVDDTGIRRLLGVGLGWALPGRGVVFGTRWHFEGLRGDGMGLRRQRGHDSTDF